MLSYIFTYPKIDEKITVGVAESVTAGSLSTILCSEPGAMTWFKGGIVAYSMQSKADLLDIDIIYAENNNFMNPFTTEQMAKKAAEKLKSRIGLSTTGYSLPIQREASDNQCALNIINPCVCIGLYDRFNGQSFTVNYEIKYNAKDNDKLNKARAQAQFSIKAKKIYDDYCSKLRLM